MLGKQFKKAREFLGLSQNAIAKRLGINHQSIGRVESNHITNINWSYVKFLIEQGINIYYLVGKSEEITGQKVTGFVSEEEYEKLKEELEDLQGKYDALRDILEVDVDEDGNVKKRNPNL